ncbi:MAG TPA: hypothetical protein VFQ68_07460 [Streptosporangiaceae bacterium]|nr:hypothetical protein [Streptosporangiaceae bacterium]
MTWKLVLTRLVTTRQMNAERAVRRARALALGRYPSAAAVARTRAAVSALTRAEPFSAREAVLTDTPLRRVTCLRSTAMVRKRSHTGRPLRHPRSGEQPQVGRRKRRSFVSFGCYDDQN